MADICDMAQESMDADDELRARARAAKPTPPYGPAECTECGDTMPEIRRTWGCVKCVHCQEIAEKMLARGLSL